MDDRRHGHQELGSSLNASCVFVQAYELGVVAVTRGRLVPTPSDERLYAHFRMPLDMMVYGCSASLFHEQQRWSTMLSYETDTRPDSQLSRMNGQMFPCNFRGIWLAAARS